MAEYRRLKARGDVDDMRRHSEVTGRAAELEADVRQLVAAIEHSIAAPYTQKAFTAFARPGIFLCPIWPSSARSFRPPSVGKHVSGMAVSGWLTVPAPTVSGPERLARIATALVAKKR